mmetsp:Transcript_40370/g.104478  ORF Transcript_40370/g.104478 Transcript_40370/m.104478 type:complete len:202 (+) Transcript_40370:226-831(+)
MDTTFQLFSTPKVSACPFLSTFLTATRAWAAGPQQPPPLMAISKPTLFVLKLTFLTAPLSGTNSTIITPVTAATAASMVAHVASTLSFTTQEQDTRAAVLGGCTSVAVLGGLDGLDDVLLGIVGDLDGLMGNLLRDLRDFLRHVLGGVSGLVGRLNPSLGGLPGRVLDVLGQLVDGLLGVLARAAAAHGYEWTKRRRRWLW